ncbi:Histone deacetylase HOS3 [Exophiala dermatitidis]
MDPDIPAPSIERDTLPDATSPFTNVSNNETRSDSATTTASATALNSSSAYPARSSPSVAASIPLPPSSPMRTPKQTPLPGATKSYSPKPPSRSPSVTSSHRGERQTTPRQSTPTLISRRSTPSLNVSKGGTPQQPQFRRASSNLNPSSPAPNGKMAPPLIPERPLVTASSVAREYFQAELEAHTTIPAPVAVIVHDSCYGHRFSRPRATKNALATIVERPERIHATVLGASAAYVRLGERHADGRYAPRPKHHTTDVRDVPFQIRKTSRKIPLTHPSVAFVHGSKWMEELQIMCDTAEGKLALNGKELVRPIGYGKDEAGNPLPKLHEGDLYLCAESLAAFQGCLGGVCDAIDTVFSPSVTNRAFVCIRPPGHHCSSNYPSGFCWLNNVHVGIAYAAMNHGLTHAAIIDFDLHHGDGSQNIAWDQNRKAHTAAKNAAQYKKTPIGYYSLHDINSYPCEWGDEEKVRNASLCIENAHGQSIWNVHLEPWKTPDEFWRLYANKYTVLLEKARTFLRNHTARLRASGHVQPKAAIFISAGFDASEWEGAGMQRHSVNVPTDFYARFTADIVKLSHEEGLGVDGRVISVLEGGYSDRALTSGVFSHICGLAGDTIGQDAEVSPTSNVSTINNWTPQAIPTPRTGGKLSYTPEWWARWSLEELEAVVAGYQPQGTKPAKDRSANYSSPTQASTLKMTEQAREKQSLASLQARLSLESQYEPPPPDVDWATAAYELSRVVIPADRQTLSCTHEELNAEATKARRERVSNHAASAAPVASEERMQLRDRKPRAPPTSLAAGRTTSRNGNGNRRTTIAAVSDLPDPSLQHPELPNGRPRRRSSDASSILSSFQGMKISEDGPEGGFADPPSRAPSAVPEKAPKAVAVKKTRTAPTTKGAVKPKSSPRKPKGTTASAVAGATALAEAGLPLKTKPDPDGSTRVTPTATGSQNGSTVRSQSDDMESLSNGFKKISIKLKVPTPEEHAARQQQQKVAALEEKQKKPRAPRKPLLPKTSKQVKTSSPPRDTNTDENVPLRQQVGNKSSAGTNETVLHAKSEPEQMNQNQNQGARVPLNGNTANMNNVKEQVSSSGSTNQLLPSAASTWPQNVTATSPASVGPSPVTSQTPTGNVPESVQPRVPGSLSNASVIPPPVAEQPSSPQQQQQTLPPQSGTQPNLSVFRQTSDQPGPGPGPKALTTNNEQGGTKQNLPVFTAQSAIPFAPAPAPPPGSHWNASTDEVQPDQGNNGANS